MIKSCSLLGKFQYFQKLRSGEKIGQTTMVYERAQN